MKLPTHFIKSTCLNCGKAVRADAFSVEGFTCAYCGFFSRFERALSKPDYRELKRAREIEGWPPFDERENTWAVLRDGKFICFYASKNSLPDVLKIIRTRNAENEIHLMDRHVTHYTKYLNDKPRGGFKFR